VSDRLRRRYTVNFTMLVEPLIFDKEISDRAVRLWAMLDRLAGSGESSMPTRAKLGEMLGCSLRSVDRYIGELRGSDWLEVTSGKESGSPSVYVVTVREGCAASVAPSQQGCATDDAPLRNECQTPAQPVTHPQAADQQKPGSIDREIDDRQNTSAPPTRPDVERICSHLADRIEENTGTRPTVGKNWRTSARLLLDQDARTEEQVHAAIDWCQGHDFWRSNILSMSKLRQQYSQLRLQAQRSSLPVIDRRQAAVNDRYQSQMARAQARETQGDAYANGRVLPEGRGVLSPAADG